MPPCDESLEDPLVVDGWARPEESYKKIEQVGKGYELLKKRYAKLAERMEKGASAHFDSTDDESNKKDGSGSSDEDSKEDQERREQFEAKRKKKTKA